MRKRLIVAAACLVSVLQAAAVGITDMLAKQGFEDIRVNLVDSVVYASVELQPIAAPSGGQPLRCRS